METASLQTLADELLARAGDSHARRASRTVIGGRSHRMRQTVVALCGGAELAEHETPGEATLFVLAGHVELVAGEESWQARRGDLIDIPPRRHSLLARQDSAVLLTALPREFVT